METLVEKQVASQWNDQECVLPQASNLAGNVTSTDRRLLLAASFRLLLRRLHHGIILRRSDLVRLLDYAERDA